MSWFRWSQTHCYLQNNSQGPAVWHQEPYLTLCNNLYGKRTWRSTYIPLCMCESSCCIWKRKKNPQYFKASMNSRLYYWKKKKKKKCWLCFCLCGLGWCLIPGTSAGLGSKCGVSRGWWGCVSQCAPSPNRSGLPAALCMSSQPPDPGQSSCSENKPRAPKE